MTLSPPTQLSMMEIPLQVGAAKNNAPSPLSTQSRTIVYSQERQAISISHATPKATYFRGQVSGNNVWEMGAPFFCPASPHGMEVLSCLWHTENTVALTLLDTGYS